MTQPPDITSMVESNFAVSTAGRCGTITEVRNRMREVLAARWAMAASWRSLRRPLGNSPVSEYGYRAWISSGSM